METRWTIRLFAGLAERLGGSTVQIMAEADGLTAGMLKDRLAAEYPEHAELIRLSFAARNEAYAADGEPLRPGDDIALLPPVSGGEPGPGQGIAAAAAEDGRYVLTAEPLDPDQVLAHAIVPEHGANLVFVGTTREWTDGKRTIKLEYEAYPPMAVKTMKQIGDEIGERWPGARCAIAHRIGTVEIAEASVVIAVSAPRRGACYEASRYAIERLKQIVPIWKKEIWEDGSEWLGHQLGPWDPTAPAAE